MARTKVFISYSHADRRFLDRLRVFLTPLERDGRVEWWDDTRLKAGSKWREEIKAAVDSARVAVLLISADFFASDFIHKKELPPLLEAAARDEAVLLSVILQPVDFRKSKLSDLQAINDPARPLGRLRTRAERDEVWVKVTQAIETALVTEGPGLPVSAPSAPAPTPEPPKPASKRRRKKKVLMSAPPETAAPSEKSESGEIEPVIPAKLSAPAVPSPPQVETFPPQQRSYLQRFLWRAVEVWDEFKSCRASLIGLILAYWFFTVTPEGVEAMRMLSEGFVTEPSFPPALWFFLALIFCGVCNWYTARVLFYFDFPGVRRPLPSTASWDKRIDTLQRVIPRLLGAAPFLVAALGFLNAFSSARGFSFTTTSPLGFAALSFLLGIVFYFALVLRRRLVGKMPSREFQSFRELSEANTGDLGAMGKLVCLISLASLALFTFHPAAGQFFGPGAIVLLAISSWVTIGSICVYLGSRAQVPVIAAAVILAALFSFWNDNHAIRTMPPRQDVSRGDVIQSFRAWYELAEQNDGVGARHSLFVVAAAGGGIRAAYWTSLVLGGLQDANPAFASHLFAISGVSGGSLGATVFNALLADHGQSQGAFKFTDKAGGILSQDFVSPTLAAMLYPDFIQRFLPFPVAYFDRARAMEMAWEKSWRDVMGNNRFSDSFVDLWKVAPGTWMPALFLNGTSVERGNRIITSNLRLTNIFLDAYDAATKLTDDRLPATKAACNIPLSTAVNMSARTYMNPAGRLPEGSHVVDGGFFDVSGATTALEIIKRIKDECEIKRITNVDIKVILIGNAPEAGLNLAPARSEPAALSRLFLKPSFFVGELTATLFASLNARNAHGIHEQKLMAREQRPFKANEPDRPPSETRDFVYFGLADMDVPLPSGWILSRSAARAIRQQLYLNNDLVKNGEAMNEVLRSLPPPRP